MEIAKINSHKNKFLQKLVPTKIWTFKVIEQIRDHHTNTKAENRRQLEAREDYWMLRLRTLKPSGMNDSLNSGTRQRLHDICA